MTVSTALAPPSPQLCAMLEDLVTALRAADNLNAGFIDHLCEELGAIARPAAAG